MDFQSLKLVCLVVPRMKLGHLILRHAREKLVFPHIANY